MRMKPPRVVVAPEPRKIGRPRSVSASDQPPAGVFVAFDADDYDFAFKIANRDRVSVPEVIRRAFRDWRARNSGEK